MLTVSDAVRLSQPKSRKPGEDELRRLPYKHDFIYGRVSTPSQVRDSRESIREIAALVELARKDGYRTTLDPAEIEVQLLSGDPSGPRVWEDGEVTVDVRDLGVSGQLLADERKGLAHLQQVVEKGTHGAVYVTEGVSRLSRDQDYVLPYQLLRLLKQKQVRVRSIDGIWNPAVERDWQYLKEQFEEAIEEKGLMNRRLHRRKARKAGRGEFVGEPIVAGYFLPVASRKTNGQYEYGKMQPYPPHAAVTLRIIEELIRQDGSEYKAIHALADLTYPCFPEELRYMERLTALRLCPRGLNGYRITPSLIRGLSTNLRLIGIWTWGNAEPVLDNHQPIVPEDLFLKAYELRCRPQKPRGRVVHFEPMEWSGLLHCMNHPEPVRVASHRAKGFYHCDHDFNTGEGRTCYSIVSHRLDRPLTSAVLAELDFTPHAVEVLARLEASAREGKLRAVSDRHEITALDKELARWESLLLGCVDEATGAVDKEKEAYYWERKRTVQSRLVELKRKPVASAESTVPDFAQVKKFMEGLSANWRSYSATSRNRLLKLLIERVELRGYQNIEAKIYWKNGFTEIVMIERPGAARAEKKPWQASEDDTLRRLYHSAPRADILRALDGRSWKSITQRARRLDLGRATLRHSPEHLRRWSDSDELALQSRYEAGKPVADIAKELGRSEYSVRARVAMRKLTRPGDMPMRADSAARGGNNLTPLQLPSPTRGEELRIVNYESRHWRVN